MNTIKHTKPLILYISLLLILTTLVPQLSGLTTNELEHKSTYQPTITFIEKSTGLQTPAKEGGDTEYELADINNDGHLDLISVGDHGSPYINSPQHGIMVWLGDGDATWTVHQIGNFGYGGIEAGDLDLDGYLDVVWGIHHDYSSTPGFGDTLIGAALGDGTATNWIPWATGLGTAGEDWGMFETDLADFDCNGLLDLISQSFGCCNGYHQYENNGDGTWTHHWSLTGGNTFNDLETADFNADGYPDFAGNKDNFNIFFGDGNFGFIHTPTGLPLGGWRGLDVGDVNKDGYDDIVFGYSSSGVRCYIYNPTQNNWEPFSTNLPTTGTYYPQLGDLNGDNHLDIFAYDEPTGTTYLGDSTGNWQPDATITVPSPGYISEILVDGDFDHDGREDLILQSEQGGWPTYQNYLRAFSPYEQPTTLSAHLRKPIGGETYRSGSIRHIKWLAAIPPAHGDATVTLQISHNSTQGPWDTIATNLPNNGCYQWLIDTSGSTHCRIKTIITTATSQTTTISPNDFTILGYHVNAHGPYIAGAGEPIQFTGTATNGNPPYTYHWNFGDGNTSLEQNPIHTYTTNNNYTVTLTVTDEDDITIRDHTWALINSNLPPTNPTINGPHTGKPNTPYTFTFEATDPNNDNITYTIDWGDDTIETLGPHPSGQIIHANHTWTTKGTYQLKAKASDPYTAESNWTIQPISIPTTHPYHTLLQQLIQQLFTHFFSIFLK